MMSWIMIHVLIHVFLTGWTVLTGECACDLTNRVTYQDAGINITRSDQTCELLLQSSFSGKQVVAAFYNLNTDCANQNGKGNITIWDGSAMDKSQIISSCMDFGHNVSYASRKNGLVIRLSYPYKPFNINAYLIDKIKNYTEPTGTIKSERYPGYYSSIYALTAPNNFHAFYNITLEEKVTISLVFKELNVETILGGNCKDSVKIHGIIPHPIICGSNTLPLNMTLVTDDLSIEFQTDNLNAYPGFEAEYVVRTSTRMSVSVVVEFYRMCPFKCLIPINMCATFGKPSRILSLFKELRGESFIFFHVMLVTIAAVLVIIIVAAFISVSAIVVVIIVFILVRRRINGTENRKNSTQKQEDIPQVKFKVDTEGGDIYMGNEDYDVAGMKREHKNTPNESNSIYGGTNGSSEYAVVNRTRAKEKNQTSNKYGGHQFEYVSDQTTEIAVKERDDNLYD